MYMNGAIDWSAKLVKIIPDSTCEAETAVASFAAKAPLQLRGRARRAGAGDGPSTVSTVFFKSVKKNTYSILKLLLYQRWQVLKIFSMTLDRFYARLTHLTLCTASPNGLDSDRTIGRYAPTGKGVANVPVGSLKNSTAYQTTFGSDDRKSQDYIRTFGPK